MNLKQHLHKICTDYINERIARIISGMTDLEAALKMESKCTVGDKYETGRAMINLEFDKLSHQLDQLRQLKRTLGLIDREKSSGEITFGSVVRTSAANYFIAIPAGQISFKNEKFYAIGTNSPVAQVLLGKTEAEVFILNGNSNKILSVE